MKTNAKFAIAFLIEAFIIALGIFFIVALGMVNAGAPLIIVVGICLFFTFVIFCAENF